MAYSRIGRTSKLNTSIEERVRNAKHTWYHNFEAVPGSGVYTISKDRPTNHHLYLKHFELDKKFWKGKRVLDIGTFSGALAFYAEEMGASEVVGIDVMKPEDNGFALIKELRNSKVKHVQAAVYDLNAEDFGMFDIIMFFGVIYHLKHPLLALEKVNEVCKNGGTLIGAGTTSDLWFHQDDDRSCSRGVNFSRITRTPATAKEAINVDSLNDLPLCGFASEQYYLDRTNWFIPNSKCLDGWLTASGFSLARPSSFVPAPIHAEWNTENVPRSSGTFHGVKSGPPAPEYVEEVYSTYLKDR